jgi:hypothetical protein
MNTVEEAGPFVPPYISFSQLQSVLERMRNEGVPSRVDRSYLSSWSGTAQAQFLKAARSLDLLDEQGRPAELLKELARDPDSRPRLISQLLHTKYPEAVALAPNATQQQLSDVFNAYDGISGETTRKAMTFYLHAAQFAGISLSPFFKVGRAASGGSGSRTGARRRPRVASAEDTPPATRQSQAGDLHPAIVTLVQALPQFGDDATTKPEFSSTDRDAWFAYAKATFNLIYARPEGDRGDAT